MDSIIINKIQNEKGEISTESKEIQKICQIDLTPHPNCQLTLTITEFEQNEEELQASECL